MSLMFNKLNAMYYYLSQSDYIEKYMKIIKIILENKYDDNIFMSNKEIDTKYKKKKVHYEKQGYYDKIPDDIESNLDEIDNQTNVTNGIYEYEEDNDSVCSHVIIESHPCRTVADKSSNDDDFCYISMCDMV